MTSVVWHGSSQQCSLESFQWRMMLSKPALHYASTTSLDYTDNCVVYTWNIGLLIYCTAVTSVHVLVVSVQVLVIPIPDRYQHYQQIPMDTGIGLRPFIDRQRENVQQLHAK